MKRFALALLAVLFGASVASASNKTVVSYGPSSPIPAAGTVVITEPFQGLGNNEINYIAMQVFFDVTTAGGTTINAYLQTTVDDGLVWRDVCDLQILVADVTKFCAVSRAVAAAVATAASDGALANDTIANGIFGDKWRVKLVIVGAYNADNIYRLHISYQKNR